MVLDLVLLALTGQVYVPILVALWPAHGLPRLMLLPVLPFYVIMPIAYWTNLYKARSFPIFSDDLFMSNGQKYNISAITDSKFHLDMEAYEREGPLYLSTMFAMSYGIGFACLSATLVHVLLFHGR